MKAILPPAADEPAGKQIDYVAKRLAQLLKPHAFTRTSRRFNRLLTSGGVIDAAQSFNLQGSQGNFGSTGRFCINLGVWFEPLADAMKQMGRWQTSKAPETLAPHEGHLNLRVHKIVPAVREAWWPAELVPDRDSWFPVGPEHELVPLADAVVRVVETYVLPWFAARGSIEAVALGLSPAGEDDRAIALGALSRGAEARAFYATCSKRKPDVEAWLARLP